MRTATAEDETLTASWAVWSKEPSVFFWEYDAEEKCLILEGKAVVTPKGGEPVIFGKGDFVVFPKGLSCEWKILEPIRKRYAFG